MNILWQDVAQEFEPDGALRDIYVSPATVSDWQRALEYVRQHGTDLEYRIDNQPAALPPSVDEVFAVRKHAGTCLTFYVGRIHFAVHFFAEDEIELDYWPRDVRVQQDLDCLLGFTKQLGDLLAKPVRLTHENCFENPFSIYDPSAGTCTYIPI